MTVPGRCLTVSVTESGSEFSAGKATEFHITRQTTVLIPFGAGVRSVLLVLSPCPAWQRRSLASRSSPESPWGQAGLVPLHPRGSSTIPLPLNCSWQPGRLLPAGQQRSAGSWSFSLRGEEGGRWFLPALTWGWAVLRWVFNSQGGNSPAPEAAWPPERPSLALVGPQLLTRSSRGVLSLPSAPAATSGVCWQGLASPVREVQGCRNRGQGQLSGVLLPQHLPRDQPGAFPPPQSPRPASCFSSSPLAGPRPALQGCGGFLHLQCYRPGCEGRVLPLGPQRVDRGGPPWATCCPDAGMGSLWGVTAVAGGRWGRCCALSFMTG